MLTIASVISLLIYPVLPEFGFNWIETVMFSVLINMISVYYLPYKFINLLYPQQPMKYYNRILVVQLIGLILIFAYLNTPLTKALNEFLNNMFYNTFYG